MFEESAKPDGKLFLQDGDPSQNSALAQSQDDKGNLWSVLSEKQLWNTVRLPLTEQ